MNGFTYTNISAAPAADTDGYVTTVDMAVGAYALAATTPAFGARHVTCTRTVVGNADTPGTLVVVGKNLAGQAQTETLIPGAHGILVTGTKFFTSITSITGVAWVVDVGTTTADTIVVGWDAVNAVVDGGGMLHAIVVNATAAGAITVADSRGTIASLKVSIGEGTYYYDIQFSGYLRVEPAAASNITVIHSGTMPTRL